MKNRKKNMRKGQRIIETIFLTAAALCSGCSSDTNILDTQRTEEEFAKELSVLLQNKLLAFMLWAAVANLGICAFIFIKASNEEAVSWARDRIIKILWAEIAFLSFPIILQLAIKAAS